MNILGLVFYFLAGFASWNCIPHLVKGITGQTHMTPFRRVSPPELNIIWSFVNVLLALIFLGLASGNGVFVFPWNANLSGLNMWVYLLGGFAVSMNLASFWKNPNARLPWHKD